MAHYYLDDVVGAGTPDDPEVPAHEADHGADPANYSHHYRGNRVVIASRVQIPTYEDLADDPDSNVEVLDAEDDDRVNALMTPPGAAEESAESDEEEE